MKNFLDTDTPTRKPKLSTLQGVGVSGICLKKTENVGTLKLFKKLSGENEKGSEKTKFHLKSMKFACGKMLSALYSFQPSQHLK